MKLFIACLTFVVFLASANAQYDKRGPCPEVKLQEELDLKKFMGTWYKHVSYPLASGRQVCYHAYNDLKGNTFNYTRTDVKDKVLETFSNPITYIGGGKFDLLFNGNKSVENVLATDYDNYLIFYSCKVNGDTHRDFIAIITRNPNPSDEVVNTAKTIIADRNFSVKDLTNTRSKDCKV